MNTTTPQKNYPPPKPEAPLSAITDLDIISEICPKKLGVTEETIKKYSEELSGHEKNLFDDLNPAQKNNVVAFSMANPQIIDYLEIHPHYLAGIHSKDVAFLIRIHRACEKCRQKNREQKIIEERNKIKDLTEKSLNYINI